MASQAEDPMVLRRRLRVELRTLRKRENLTQAEAAGALDWSPSKILRIESGDVRVAPSDVRLLTQHYGVTDKRQIERLVEMARQARNDPYAAYKDVHPPTSIAFFGYEAASSRIRDWSLSFVPGLLQVEDYALQLLEHTFRYDKKEREHRWQARAQRQTLLERPDFPEMFFLLDEGVVRRTVGDAAVMRRQLQHLVELGRNRRITIRVVPFGAGAHPGMSGPFILLEFADPSDDDVLYLEYAEEFIRDERIETTRYLERFFEMEDIALPKDDTRTLLEEIIAELSDEIGERVTERSEE